MGTCDVQLNPNTCRQAKFEAGIYLQTPRENIAHCFPVGDVALFDSHHGAIADFPGKSVSDWTVDLNTWNNNREPEDAGRSEDTS